MTKDFRLPSGKVVSADELERGIECDRCGLFVEMSEAVQPKPEVQRYRIKSEGFAVTSKSKNHHTTRGGGANVEGTICPDCQKDLIKFMNEDLQG
jgi:ssDNA-binding Zn-finger/Zn-ribbon topoisomerase 1